MGKPYSMDLRERIKTGDFTLRELTIDLAEHGLEVSERTVWDYPNLKIDSPSFLCKNEIESLKRY